MPEIGKFKKKVDRKHMGMLPLKKQAEKFAKGLSSNPAGGEVKIRGLDGKIRDSVTCYARE